MVIMLTGHTVVPGLSEGTVLSSDKSISFWGDVDPKTARINNPRHPLFGQSIQDRVLVFPVGKGSSTGSLIMLELIRIGKTPAAIVNIRTEPILATGSIVGKYFYGRSIPIMCLDEKSFGKLKPGKHAIVDAMHAMVKVEDIG